MTEGSRPGKFLPFSGLRWQDATESRLWWREATNGELREEVEKRHLCPSCWNPLDGCECPDE